MAIRFDRGAIVRAKVINVIASAIGLVLLISMVSLAAFLYTRGEHFWIIAIAGYLLTVPFAIRAWNCYLIKDKDFKLLSSWKEWVGLFLISAVMSAIFITIDIIIRYPGLSVIFTMAAVSTSFIALPSAIRAWVLKLLSDRYIERNK